MLAGVVILLIQSQTVMAQEAGEDEPKLLSGMSVVGNDEAPKSLFIVPWKSSEIGFETDLASQMLDDSLRPVDKDVFMRELNYYEIRHAN